MQTNLARSAVTLLLAATAIFGQANQGSITGTIRDQTGAAMPNIPVEIKNPATGAVYSGGASDTGNFVVPVPVGTYDLTVSAPNFKKFVQTGIPVVEGVATRRDVQLELGQASETITVTDTQPLLKTESGDISYRVTSQMADNLPVLPTTGGSWFGATALGNIRNPLSATQILPGVQFANDQTLVVNGLPSNSETITIEGQDATGTLWKVIQQQSQGGMDAVEAMNIQSSNYAAEYGKAAGGVINYTMKSGTNQYHGSIYNYYANEFLNAGTPFTNYANISTPQNNFQYNYKDGEHIRNVVRRYDYGATLGGPISIPKLYNGKDRTFFFANFEQFRQSSNIGTGIATMPIPAYRTGDFTNAGCLTYVPATNTCAFRPTVTYLDGSPAIDPLGNQVVYGGVYNFQADQTINGTIVRPIFPGNQVPVALFDTVSQNIQAQFPLPNAPGLINNYAIPTYTNYQHTTIPSIKIDQVLSSTIKINGYWGVNLNQSPNANGFSQAFTSATRANTRNNTVRLNYDQTISPTLLFHVGIGYYHQRQPTIAVPYNQADIGLFGYPYPNIYPTTAGLFNGTSGGFSMGFGNTGTGAPFDAVAYEEKPTANLNMTWVKGNHTMKFGGDLTIMGYPTYNNWRSNGNFVFGNAPTSDPWQSGQALNFLNPSGFEYATFLTGRADNMQVSQQTQTKTGGHAFAFFVQDNWKISPRLTMEYGLRWDYQTYLSEQYGRMQNASFSTPNEAVGGLLGAVIYEGDLPGRCQCRFSSNYPWAFGPRVSLSYQIAPKTVFRAGFGVSYGVVQTPAGANFSVADYYSINTPGYGLTPLPNGLEGGNPYAPGNPYGNPTLPWPNFNESKYPTPNGGLLPPQTPFIFYNPGARPGRIGTWSVGLQHELVRNLVVEASYVGNRGVWFYAPTLNEMAYNSLTPARLALFGLDIQNAADRTLLQSRIDSPAAAARGIFAPYAGFPSSQFVNQAIRPVPQWAGAVNPYLGPPNGKTWYDSLQVQATKRYSYGIDMTVNFTYSHSMVLGASQDTDFFLPGRPVTVDPFNRENNKQLNQLVPPLKTVISGTYTTPGWNAQGMTGKTFSQILRDWQIGLVFQYQSGQLLQTPNSNNQLPQQLLISPPGTFGPTFYNPWNKVQGQPYYAAGFDPNGNFDPRTQVVANPAAWSNPAPGNWGVTAPFNGAWRWRRAPNEAFNFGRNFRFGREKRYVLQVRAEFQNIFNRLFYSAPDTSNPLAPPGTTTQGGSTFFTSGYGVVNTLNGNGSRPRTGLLVGRFTF